MNRCHLGDSHRRQEFGPISRVLIYGGQKILANYLSRTLTNWTLEDRPRMGPNWKRGEWTLETQNGQNVNTDLLWEVREMEDVKMPLDFKNKSRDQRWKRIFSKRSFWNWRTLEASPWIFLLLKETPVLFFTWPVASPTAAPHSKAHTHRYLCKCVHTPTKTSKERHTSACPPLTPPQQRAVWDLKSSRI